MRRFTCDSPSRDMDLICEAKIDLVIPKLDIVKVKLDLTTAVWVGTHPAFTLGYISGFPMPNTAAPRTKSIAMIILALEQHP
jgi:hypothetical protein